MGKEIERKFLVNSNTYATLATNKKDIIQGYLSRNPESTVRVRIFGSQAFLTVKGKNHGAERDEWEYEIPMEEAHEMLQKVVIPPIISKTRYIVPFHGYTWEVDEFHGTLEGLRIAEIELSEADMEIPIPDFIGEEVTGNPIYYNSNLSNMASI